MMGRCIINLLNSHAWMSGWRFGLREASDEVSSKPGGVP
jgi:hypothetical protein